MNSKKTLVLGASPNPDRAAYQAVARLEKNDHEVIPFGIRKGNVEGIPIINELPKTIPDLDTITLYLNPKAQESYQDYIRSLKPKRVIFNPGTENRKFAHILEENGIEVLTACTLVMLSLKNY